MRITWKSWLGAKYEDISVSGKSFGWMKLEVLGVVFRMLSSTTGVAWTAMNERDKKKRHPMENNKDLFWVEVVAWKFPRLVETNPDSDCVKEFPSWFILERWKWKEGEAGEGNFVLSVKDGKKFRTFNLSCVSKRGEFVSDKVSIGWSEC